MIFRRLWRSSDPAPPAYRSRIAYLPPPVARSLANRTPNSDLRPREREVLARMVMGKTNKGIADELRITEATVKCHVSVILQRLSVTDRTQAVVAALQRGLKLSRKVPAYAGLTGRKPALPGDVIRDRGYLPECLRCRRSFA